MLRRAAAACCALLCAAATLPARALDPSQLFEKVSPSIWIVLSYDAADKSTSLGSAVVIEPGKLITNCHVITKSKVILLRRANVMYEAKLEHRDASRDLCLLQVDNFNAPPVTLRSAQELKVGERVYAIGNPKGLEVTLSEGLISGLRQQSESTRTGPGTLVQTSAALSSGSSGGGLFDAEGRLVGITTFGWRDAQNLNIALPTDWIEEVAERAQAAVAKRNSPVALAAGVATVPPGYPSPGTAWTYNFTERVYSRRTTEVTVRVLSVVDSVIEEVITAKARSAKLARRSIDVRDPRVLEYPLSSDSRLIEVLPYLLLGRSEDDRSAIAGVVGYPNDGAASGLADWVPTTRVGEWEEITVPAGRFRALRIEIEGARDRAAFGPIVANRFTLRVWLSAEAKRIVRLEHKVWANTGTPMADDLVELVAYQPPAQK